MFRRRPARPATPAPAAEPAPDAAAAGSHPSILDDYVREAPSAQLAVDLFAGQWSSALPADLGVSAGQVPLFDDPRIHWVVEQIGGIDDLRVLELGPLEAGHTAMLERAGASVLAIEANTRAYLKCLVVKELLGLGQSHFLLGDFGMYLRDTDETFDLVLASGVLYHASDPLGLLERIARVAPAVAIWTHYFDPEVVESDPESRRRFTAPAERASTHGVEVTLHPRDYLESLAWSGFCGGPEHFARWMERDDLLAVLGALGFDDIAVQYDDRTNPNGACIMLLARRTGAAGGSSADAT
jgi:SAM-dependent methyltransferase